MKECGELMMVRCERFVKMYRGKNEHYNSYEVQYFLHPFIFDRVKQKTIVDVDTGDNELDDELIESILTMLNIKYISRDEEE